MSDVDPVLWWVAGEHLGSLLSPPLVLGSLDLSALDLDSPHDRDILQRFANTVVLRVYTRAGRQSHLARSNLPRAVSIDGEFLPTSVAFSAENADNALAQYQPPGALSQRGMDVLRVLQEIGLTAQTADELRLDLLMEDYLEHAMYTNSSLTGSRASATGRLRTKSRLPEVSIDHILRMTPSRRYDLCILLTACIITKIPRIVLTETMLLLFFEHFKEQQVADLIDLENCLKTSLIAMIHRTLWKESRVDALGETQRDENRTTVPSAQDLFPFRHLESFYAYIKAPITKSARNILRQPREPRCDLTEEKIGILKLLPSRPTRQMSEEIIARGKPSYDSWVALICREAVFLLMKASTCPSLVRPQASLMDQRHYDELMPLLSLASLTYADMNVIARDGRSKDIVAFGCGIPEGSISNLLWKRERWEEARARGSTRHFDLICDETPRPSTDSGENSKILASPEYQSRPPRFFRYRNPRFSYSSRPLLASMMEAPKSEDFTEVEEEQSPYIWTLIEQQSRRIVQPESLALSCDDSSKLLSPVSPKSFSLDNFLNYTQDSNPNLNRNRVSSIGTYEEFRKNFIQARDLPSIAPHKELVLQGTLYSSFLMLLMCA